MLKLFKNILLINGLSMLSCLNATVSTHIVNIHPIHSKPITLPSLLSSDGSNGSAGRLAISNGSPNNKKIHYLQVFFYDNTSCANNPPSQNLLGQASIIDNTAGYPVTPGSTISLNSSTAYQLAHNQNINTGSIQCMNVYMDGGGADSNGLNCQSFNNEQCTGTNCTSSTTQTNLVWGATPSECETRYAYITDQHSNFGNYYEQGFSLDNSANFTPISLLATRSYPYGIAVYNGYAYIADSNSSAGIYMCPATFGNFPADTSTCQYTATTTTTFTFLQQLTVNNGYLYVADYSIPAIFKCTLQSNGQITSTCTQTVTASDAPISNVEKVAFNNGSAYIITAQPFGANGIVQCTSVNNSGDISGCQTTGLNLGIQPVDIAFNNGYAYVTTLNNHIVQCSVDSSTGALSCQSLDDAITAVGARSLAVNNGYLYATTASTLGIYSFSMGADGTLTANSTYVVPYGAYPYGISIN